MQHGISMQHDKAKLSVAVSVQDIQQSFIYVSRFLSSKFCRLIAPLVGMFVHGALPYNLQLHSRALFDICN